MFFIQDLWVYKQTNFLKLIEKLKIFVFMILVENISSFYLETFSSMNKSTSNVLQPQADRQCHLHIEIRLITFDGTLVHEKTVPILSLDIKEC